MTPKQPQPSINSTARLAGVLYLLMGPFAAYSLSVRFGAFVHEDASRTVANIIAAQGSFMVAIVTWLVSQTMFIFLVLALYKILQPVNKGRATLMVTLALVGIPTVILNELNQFAVLFLLSGKDYLTSLPAEQVQAHVMFFLHMHDHLARP